jgi:hypothetical protein
MQCSRHPLSWMRLSADEIWICTVPRCLYGQAAADRGLHPELPRCPLHRHWIMQYVPGRPGGYRTCGVRGCPYSPGMLEKGRHPWLTEGHALV